MSPKHKSFPSTELTPQETVSKSIHVEIDVDTSPQSTVMIENLFHLISPLKANLGLIYAYPLTQTKDRQFEGFDKDAQVHLDRAVNDQLDQYTATLMGEGFQVQDRHLIHEMNAHEEDILSFIQHHPMDLLILGMQEHIPKHKGWRITPTAYTLATHAPCSVLVMKQPIVRTPVKVLFATDGSEQAEKAARDLIRFLPQEHAEITLFYAIAVNYYTIPMVEPYVEFGPLERALQGQAGQLLSYNREIFEDAGYNVTDAFFTLGDPGEYILQEAERRKTDLIVVGSRGLSQGVARWLLGSVSAKVLQYSHTSVAILR